MDREECFLEVGRFGMDGNLSVSGRLARELLFDGRFGIEGLGGMVG